MQLDIFEHSRDVMLRNAAPDALRSRDAAASAHAIAMLAAEYGGDPLLPAFNQLYGRLCLPVAAPKSDAESPVWVPLGPCSPSCRGWPRHGQRRLLRGWKTPI